MSFTLPFSQNNFLPINIKGSDAITGTYGGVSILNNGKTELKSDTTIKKLGVNKNVGSYEVDVSGNINISGTYSVNGVPISSGGGGSTYALLTTNTTLTSASPNYNGVKWTSGFNTIVLPNATTIPLGKEYTFFATNVLNNAIAINTSSGQLMYYMGASNTTSIELTTQTQSFVITCISNSSNPYWSINQAEYDPSLFVFLSGSNEISADNIYTGSNTFNGTTSITTSLTCPTITSTNGVSAKLLTTTSSSVSVSAGVMSFTATNPEATFQSFKITFTGSPFTITQVNWASIANMPINAEWYFILQNNTSSLITIKNNIVSNTAGTYLHADFPFDVIIQNIFNNGFIKIKRYDSVEAVISAGEISNSVGGTILSILNTSNSWLSQNAFNAFLPTSTLTPTTGTQLTTKTYVDGAIPASLIGQNNTWTGTNAFNTSLPTSTLTPTAPTQLITKTYADTTYHPAGSYATLGGTNAFTGNNSFNTNLPTSSLTPTTSTQLITKAYGDGAYPRLSFPNTYTNINTFNNGVYVNQTLEVNTPNQIFFNNTLASPAVGYVRYDFRSGVDTYTSTMENNTFTRNVGIQNGSIDALTITNTAVFSGAIPTYTGSSTAYANNTFFPRSYGDTRYAQLAVANTFTQQNQFNTFLPLYSGSATPLASNFITRSFAEGEYGRLGSNNAWSGATNSFTNLPTSSQVPTSGTQLVNKTYTDGAFGRLSQTNSWSGTTNTFTNALVANNLLPYFPLNTASLRMGLNALQYGTASSFANVAIGDNTLRGDSGTPANNTGSKNVCVGYNAGASLTTTSATSPDDNVIIGYGAGQNLSQAGSIFQGPSYSNVIIGSNAGQNYYIQKSVIIGTNACSAGNQFISDTTIVGYNSGLNLSNNSGVSIFGASNLPVYAGNAGQAFGCQLGANANNNDKGVFCGINLGANINTGWGCSFVGGDCANALGTGCGGVFMAGIGVDTTKSDLQNSVAIGSFFTVNEDDTFKIGGYNITTGAYQNLLIGNKNRILFNTNTSSATLDITFEMGEHIILTSNTTTTINLPVPANANIGSRFTIIRAYSTAVSITINASSGLNIIENVNVANSITMGGEFYLTLVCIGTSGTAWAHINSLNNAVLDYGATTITGAKTFSDTVGLAGATITKTTGSLSAPQLEMVANNNGINEFPRELFTHYKTTNEVSLDVCGEESFYMSVNGTKTRYAFIQGFVSVGGATKSGAINIGTLKNNSEEVSATFGGGSANFKDQIKFGNYWCDTASSTVITGTTTLSMAGANTMFKYYSVSAGATAYTITLPTITITDLGKRITFRRVGGTTTTAISFIGNGTQFVYNTALTGGATAQALMASGVYIVKLVPMVVSGTTYAWFQI